MDKIMKKIQPKHYGIVAALLAMLGMYMILSYCQVLSTGKFIIMDGDLIEQYIPFIKMFIRDILEGESIWFSWNSFMGMNTSLNNAYYVMSPFNILYLIFWNMDENIVTSLVIILKIGFAAYTFHLFLNRVVKCNGLKTVFFSLLYAMSLYMVLYGYLYNSWLDGLYMLPLICTYIYEADSNGKSYFKLIIAYVVLFISQFYIAYMVGFFSFVFWLMLLIVKGKQPVKSILKKMIYYGGSVICAVGISAVILLPAFLFLIGNIPQDAQEFKELSTHLYHLYYALFWGNRVPMLNEYPALYCGWPVLILLPLFFFNKMISKKERICAGILVLLLMLTMIIDPMYRFMHAFDSPDGFNFRHTFLLVFVLVSIACRQAMFMDRIRGRHLILVLAIHLISYPILEWAVGKDASYFVIRLLVNIVLALSWFGIWFLQKKKTNEKKLILVLTGLLLFVELCGNGWYGIYEPDSRRRDEYERWKGAIVSAVEEISEDESFYRVYYNNDMVQNSDSWFGYNGISDFSSAEDDELRQTLRALGLQISIHKSLHFGITPPVEMLLGVKYMVEGPIPADVYEENADYTIRENPYYLQLGFMVEEDVLDYEFETLSSFENINSLMAVLSGEDVRCFEAYEGQVYVECNQAKIVPADSYIAIGFDNEKYAYGYVTYYIPKENITYPTYVQFIDEDAIAYINSPYLVGGVENSVHTFGLLSTPYIKALLEGEDRYAVSILMNRNTTNMWSYNEAVFYEYREDALAQIYQRLSQNQMEVEEFADGYVKGNVTVTEDKTVLFTSIPYDEGWTVWVDGEVVEPQVVLGDTFMALELVPGYHELEFEYEAPGVKEGMIISGTSLGVYVLLVVFYLLRHRNKKNEGTEE